VVRNAPPTSPALDIAVMGCIVNGLARWPTLTTAMVGKTPGTILPLRGPRRIAGCPEAQGVEALIAPVKEDGRWVDPMVTSRVSVKPSLLQGRPLIRRG